MSDVIDVSPLGAGVATWLQTPSSANLAAAVTDETGSGPLVFGTGPTISLASASSGVTQASGDNSTKLATTAYADAAAAAGGFVVGPGSATDNALARYDGTTGKLIQNSGATLSDGGELSLTGSLGSELLTNPDFTGSATGWTLGAGWAYSANTVVHTPGNTATLSQAFTAVVGTTYRVNVSHSKTAGSIQVSVGGVHDNNDGYPVYLTAATTAGLIVTPTTDYDGTITSISMVAQTPALQINSPETSPEDPWEISYQQPYNGLVFNRQTGDTDWAYGFRFGFFDDGPGDPDNAWAIANLDFNVVGHPVQIGYTAIGTGVNYGLRLVGGSDVPGGGATASATEQYAPQFLNDGYAWNGSTSKYSKIDSQLQVHASALPTSSLVWTGESDDIAAVVALRMTSTGNLTVPGGSLAMESTPASIVTNASFTGSATGWTLGANWAYGSNEVAHSAGSTATLSQAFQVFRDAVYILRVQQTAGSAGTITVSVGDATHVVNGSAAAVDVSAFLTPSASVATGVIVTPSSDYDGTLTRVDVVYGGLFKTTFIASATTLDLQATSDIYVQAGDNGGTYIYIGENSGVVEVSGLLSDGVASFAGGITASGAVANDFSGSSGTFKTSTGANTLSGAVTINDATTPSLTTAAGKTNTGYLQVNGKTSGALKITAADATAQTITLITAAQTSGAASLTIPNQAGVNKTVAWLEGATFTSPVLTSATVTTSLVPTSNDGAPLGDTTHQFSDLFLAEGGVINWDNGDATLTQAGNVVTLAGADFVADNVTVNTALLPDANDGAALGSTTLQFSDLFLAEGAVINFDNGDATITQTGNDITVAGISTFGVGTGTAVTLGTIELGAASDTTISRSAAGIAAIEGYCVPLVMVSSGTAPGATSATTETNLANVLIPGGKLGANGTVRVSVVYKKVGTAGTCSISTRLSASSGDVSTGFQFLNNTGITATFLSVSSVKSFANANSASAQISGNAAAGDGGSGTVTVATGAINTANDSYICINALVANSGDSIQVVRYMVELMYAA